VDRLPGLLGALMAASMSGVLFGLAHQHNDRALRLYAIASTIWPPLLALGVLPQDFAFTWIVIGYAVPLVCLGVLRIIAPPE